MTEITGKVHNILTSIRNPLEVRTLLVLLTIVVLMNNDDEINNTRMLLLFELDYLEFPRLFHLYFSPKR